MTCLRLWRPLASGLAPFSLSAPAALPCALLLGLLGLLAASGPFASASAASATRSRTHHVTPALTPLHYTERSFATPHGATRGAAKGKSAAKSRAGSPNGSNDRPHTKPKAAGSAGAHTAPKHGRKHTWDAVYEAPVPMLRAGHGKLHGVGELAETKTHRFGPDRPSSRSFPSATSSRATPVPRGRRLPLASPDAAAQDTVAAQIPHRSAHGDTEARLHPRLHPDPWPATVASASHPATLANPAPLANAAPIERPAAASGVLAAAPSPAPAVTRVIDGFGSELALAPALPSEHPGLTRRRNHPVPATALSEETRSSTPAVLAASLPSTLAERDAVTAGAMTPTFLSPNLSSTLSPDTPLIYDRDGHLVMPAPLRGSRDVLVHQNTMANLDGLERISDDAQLDRLRSTRHLIDLPVSSSLRVNDDLPSNRRCARPWTALFAQDIARDFYARFHGPLWVTSAVRTVNFQARLLRVNGNAAGLSGDFASPHLTGQAIDFGKRGMTAAQLAWMRSYLLPLIQSGKIDVEEEFQQACFHISVYRRYAGGRHVLTEVVQASSQPAPYPPSRQPLSTLRHPATVLTNPEITDTEP